MKRKPLSIAGQIVVIIVIVIALFWVLFPFYWAFLNSIKKPAETFQPTWIPFLQFTPTLEHWQAELARLEPRLGKNKAIVAIARKLLLAVWHVLTEGCADRFADAEFVARKLLKHAYRLGRAHRPQGLSPAQYVRQQLDRLGLGQDLSAMGIESSPCRSRVLAQKRATNRRSAAPFAAPHFPPRPGGPCWERGQGLFNSIFS